MGIRIGTDLFGRVEKVDRHLVQTKFFMIGIPLVPVASYYVMEDKPSDANCIEIPLHGKSVLAGYLRLPMGVAVLMAAIYLGVETFGSYSSRVTGTEVLGFLALLAVWLFLVFSVGKLSDAELRERRLLKQLSGIALPPEALGPELREKLAAALEGAWRQSFPGEDWRALTDASGLPSDKELLVWALNRYLGGAPSDLPALAF